MTVVINGGIMDKHDRVWISLMNFGHKLGCHQMADRSFFFKGYQFPVCARCTGVILGELIAIILIIFKLNMNILFSITLLLIMGFDWFIQYINLLESNNLRRVITGTLGGLGLTYIYYYIFLAFVNMVKLLL